MKPHIKIIPLFVIVVSMSIAAGDMGYGQIVPGQKAPVFELSDISGKRYNLAELDRHLMIILYFFDVASGASREGLRTLDDLAKRYVDADMMVWAITHSAKDKVMEFVSKSHIDYPVLLDTTTRVSDLYQAGLVLPTICILGPQLQILNYIQGGGKSIEIMLVKLAEKGLQRKRVALAKAISQEVTRLNSKNIEAEMIKGYAELKDGDVNAAEKTFRSMSQSDGLAKVMGQEGLVSVHAARGDSDKALKLAAEVEKMAPDRGYVNVVKADILYSQGKKAEAQAELQKFLHKKSATPFQEADGLNKIGQLQAEAEMIKGYAELKDGDVNAAEKTFRSMSQSDGLAKVMGQEGLVSVHAARGDSDKALKLAAKIEKMAPDRGYVNVVKADILYSQGKKDEAQAELQKFVHKKSATSFQEADGLNKIGQLQAEAEMIKGYAELKDGDVNAAEKTFRSMSQSDGLAKVMGQEGLVSVHAARGDSDKALKLAAEVEKMAPDRGYVNVVKADILYSQGKKAEAQAELQKFLHKKSATSFQEADGLNKIGQLQAEKGNFNKAVKFYDQAEAIAPFNIEVTVNRGWAYEKDGKWDKALSIYREALSMDGDVDRAIKKMRNANIAFNVPKSMMLSETIEIILILDLTKSIEELTQMIKSKEEKEGASIKATNRMGAELIGSNFQITAISEKIQVITSQNATEWRWAIKPIIPGDHEVYLSLNAYFEVKGRNTPKTIQTFRKTIQIEVTWTKLTKDFFQNNWQWLWTSFFIPITIWLWRKRKKNYDVDKKKKTIFE